MPGVLSGRRTVALWSLKLALGLGILGILFTRIPLSAVAAQAVEASGPLLAAAVSAAFATQLVLAWRLATLVRWQRFGIGLMKVLRINLAAVFYGLFLPAGNVAGIGLRVYRVARDDGRFAAAGVAVLVDRLVAAGSLALVGCLFFVWDRPGRMQLVAVLLAAALVASLGFVLILGHPARVRVGRTGALRGWLPRRITARIDEARAAGTLRLSTLSRVTAQAVLGHLLGLLSYWLVLRAMEIPLDVATLGWMRSTILLVAMVPISVSGLGLREASSWLLLAAYGVAEAQAVTYALLVFAATVLVVGVAGGIVETLGFARPRPGPRSGRRPSSDPVVSRTASITTPSRC